MKIKAKENLFLIREDPDIFFQEKTQKRTIFNCLFEYRYDIMIKLLLILIMIVILCSINDKINNTSSDIKKNINNGNITKYNITNKTKDNFDNFENFVETNLVSHEGLMPFSKFKNISYKIDNINYTYSKYYNIVKIE